MRPESARRTCLALNAHDEIGLTGKKSLPGGPFRACREQGVRRPATSASAWGSVIGPETSAKGTTRVLQPGKRRHRAGSDASRDVAADGNLLVPSLLRPGLQGRDDPFLVASPHPLADGIADEPAGHREHCVGEFRRERLLCGRLGRGRATPLLSATRRDRAIPGLRTWVSCRDGGACRVRR